MLFNKQKSLVLVGETLQKKLVPATLKGEWCWEVILENMYIDCRYSQTQNSDQRM